jgi:hypothetical protein
MLWVAIFLVAMAAFVKCLVEPNPIRSIEQTLFNMSCDPIAEKNILAVRKMIALFFREEHMFQLPGK